MFPEKFSKQHQVYNYKRYKIDNLDGINKKGQNNIIISFFNFKEK